MYNILYIAIARNHEPLYTLNIIYHISDMKNGVGEYRCG